MPVRKNSTFKTFYFECVMIALVFFVVVYLCRVLPNREAPEIEVLPEPPQVEPVPEPEPELHFKIRTYDDGKILNYRSEDYYRYGPSIMEYEDGSMEVIYETDISAEELLAKGGTYHQLYMTQFEGSAT